MADLAGLPTGQALHDAVAELLPIPRSLTGDGVRATLDLVGAQLPLTVHEVPTGTPALDWEVPREWRLRRATLTAPDGTVVADTDAHLLHVVGYSVGVDVELDRADLEAHLHSDPAQPDVIPYRTSYYAEDWGFCLPDRVRRGLPDGRYHARVDATLADGHLTYGEAVLPGTEPGEVLLTTHVCHPAMANDNASGIAVLAAIGAWLAARPSRRWTYRLLFLPGTIGALVWLSRHRDEVHRIVAGAVITGVGDRGRLTWKRSRRGDSLADRAVAAVLRDRGVDHQLLDFTPWGYDERQFASPGFDLPVGRLSRSVHGTYPEYHTSADDLDFVTPEALRGAAEVLADVVDVLERNRTWRNTQPYGEPQLGRRGLYPTIGGRTAQEQTLAMLWVLNQGDGTRDLVAVAERSGLPFATLADAADRLAAAGLLVPVDPAAATPP